jgi:hypothetical protein
VLFLQHQSRNQPTASVNFRDGNETTVHYADNLEDAVNTAVEMARKRAFSAAVGPVALATR